MPHKNPLKAVGQEQLDDGGHRHTATALVSDAGTAGVSVKTARVYGKSIRPGRSFWLPKNGNVAKVFAWLRESVQKLFRQAWQKEVITQEDVDEKKKTVDDLTQQLAHKQQELEDLSMKFSKQQKEYALALEVASRLDEFSAALNELEEKIRKSRADDVGVEEWVKTHIKNHRWLLGLDCEVKAKNQDIDPGTELDLHIITNFGENRIVEVKSPHLPLFHLEGKRRSLSKDASNGLSELMEYLQRTEVLSIISSFSGPYGVEKPVGRLVMGWQLDEQERKLLAVWNAVLGPSVKIITFDELLANARKELAIIGHVKIEQSRNDSTAPSTTAGAGQESLKQ